jgi:hypothetical protein
MRDILCPIYHPESPVFPGSLDTQAARWRDVVIREKDWHKMLVRENSEIDLMRKRFLTEDEFVEYPLLFRNQLDDTVCSPFLWTGASSPLRA